MAGKVLCIGDIILDSYSHGEVKRISPEAPIPVLKINNNKYEVLGGCGNVARNICAAGSQCHVISVSGDDEEALALRKLLNESKKLSYNLIVDRDRCTTKKTRFVSENQQILRVDRENNSPINTKLESKLLKLFKDKINDFDVVVISDYNKGILTDSLLRQVIDISSKKKKKVIVDPKKFDFLPYKGATIITPNYNELIEASKSNIDKSKDDESKIVIQLSRKLIKKFNFEAIVTTRSSDGISVVDDKNSTLHLPSKAKEVYDVSGAGDTVIAYIASGLANGKTLFNSTEIANDAAGVAVAKFGTTIVSENDLLNKDDVDKICTMEEITSLLKRNFYKRIGFTNGCFDLIHQGHVSYLREARKQCDFLILGLNSDKSIRKIKGKERPILNQSERLTILKNFNFIDRILVFNEETPLKIIKKIKPNVIFKGDDYTVNEVIGYKEIKEWGGVVKLIKCVKGKSTSNIIRKIKNAT